MKTVKPSSPLRPAKSLRANQSLRPMKSLSSSKMNKANFVRATLALFGLLLVSFAATAAEYVQYTCTNKIGQKTYNKVLFLDYEPMLNQLKLFALDDDQNFNDAVKYLTTIPANHRQFSRKARLMHLNSCVNGICKYRYFKRSSLDNGKEYTVTRKAQFCANEIISRTIKATMDSLESYAVED